MELSQYTVEEKLLVAEKLKRNALSAATAIKPRPYSAINKLDGKTRVSFSLES